MPSTYSGVADQNQATNFTAEIDAFKISGNVFLSTDLIFANKESSIAAGTAHSCGVTLFGAVKCWGRGPLDDGSGEIHSTPSSVSGLSEHTIEIAAGRFHSCSLFDTGAVKCWGQNYDGQLGNNSTSASDILVDAVGLQTGVKSIRVREAHSCALLDTGGVECWGMLNEGEDSDETSERLLVPTDVPNLGAGVTAITAGYSHDCALLSDKTIKCWGYNRRGQLGDGTIANTKIPVAVLGISNVKAVTAGYNFTCVLLEDGGVRCWGLNSSGQLGDGSVSNSLSPVVVSGLDSDVVRLTAGFDFACAVHQSGKIMCWGNNVSGQLGNGKSERSVTPVNVDIVNSKVLTASAGYAHTCAVTEDGKGHCWGLSNDGQLGDSNPTLTSLANVVEGLGIHSVNDIKTTYYSSCALTVGGGVKCWGSNNSGELGDGTTEPKYESVDVLGLTSNVRTVEKNSESACAITTAGGLKCWGSNYHYNLGDGTDNNQTSPVDVIGLTSGVQSVALSDYSACAVTVAGGLKCWGDNQFGNLGNGGEGSVVPTPVDVIGLDSGALSVSPSVFSSCAVTQVGGVKCWGRNTSGQLGNGSIFSSLVPVDVTGLGSGVANVYVTRVGVVYALMDSGDVKVWGQGYNNVPEDLASDAAILVPGNYDSCLLTRTGGVKCWGYNMEGELGDGTTTYTSTPVDVIGLSSGVSELALGYLYACALMSDGRVKCWGDNREGQLGNGSLVSSSVPVDVTAVQSPVSKLFVGGSTPCALLTSGEVRCWGLNSTGERGVPFRQLSPVVVVGSGGVPLADSIMFGPGLSSTPHTNDVGYYIFPAVDFGTDYSLSSVKPGYIITPDRVDGRVSGDTLHYFLATPTTLTHSISGHVFVGGQPLEGAEVSASFGDVVADSQGYFSYNAVLHGTSYTLTVAKHGYRFLSSIESGFVLSDVVVTFNGELMDSDQDGLSDLDEESLGTDPYRADTDEDGVTDKQETLDGTHPLDRGSNLAKRLTTLCTEWNGFLGMYNILEHLNMSQSVINLNDKLYSILGQEQSYVDLSVKSGRQYDLLVHGMKGFEEQTYGLICAHARNAEPGDLDGRMVFYKPDDLSGGYQFAFAMPLGNGLTGTQYVEYNTYQPSLDINDAENLVANWIQLTNLNPNRQSGELVFYDRDGAERGRQAVLLKSGARFDFSAHDIAGRKQVGLVEWIPSSSAARFQLRNVRYYYRADGVTAPLGDDFDSAFQLGGVVGNGQLLSAPLDTFASSAVLELSNTLSEETQVEVKIYLASGGEPVHHQIYKLKAHGTYHLIADAILDGGKGIATVQGSKRASVVATAMQYGRTESLGVKTVYGIQASEALGSVLRGSYNTYLEQDCQLLIVNPGIAEAIASVSLKRYDGTIVNLRHDLSIPAHGLTDYDLCSQDQDNVYGVVTVQPHTPNSIFATVLRIGHGEQYRFPTPVRE